MVGGSSVKSKTMLPEKQIFLWSSMALIQGQQSLPMGFGGIFNAEDQTEPDSQRGPLTNELLCQFNRVSRYNTT